MKMTPESRPKLSFFPDAPTGATMFARYIAYHRLSGNSTIAHSKKLLFNHFRAHANDPFGGYISKVKDVMPTFANFDFLELLEKASLFGFYGAALPAERKQKWRANQIAGHKILIMNFVGGMGGRRLSKEHLHFCQDCVLDDETGFGIGFWRLVHQIPGVHHCPRHHRRLIGACASCGQPQASNLHWNPPTINCPYCGHCITSSKNKTMHDSYINYLYLCDAIVNGEDVGIAPHQRLQTYAREMNMQKPDGDSLKVDDFILNVLNCWNLTSLEQLALEIGAPISETFIRMAIRGDDTMLNPIAHLALLATMRPSSDHAHSHWHRDMEAKGESNGPASRPNTTSTLSTQPGSQTDSKREQAKLLASSLGFPARVVNFFAEGKSIKFVSRYFKIAAVRISRLHSILKKQDMLNFNDQPVNETKDVVLAQQAQALRVRRAPSEGKISPLREKHRRAIVAAIANGRGTRNQVAMERQSALAWCRYYDKKWLDEILPIANKIHPFPERRKEDYQRRILDYLDTNQIALRTQVAVALCTEFQWCYKNDRAWLDAIIPSRTTKKTQFQA